MGRNAIGLAALLALAVAWPAQADVTEIHLYEIHGTVTDGAGRPLADVSIFDGGKSVGTDANGQYRLPEQWPGYYELYASRGDLMGSETYVDLLLPGEEQTRHDIELMYRLWFDISRDDVSVAGGPASITVTASTAVPLDGTSCVVVEDTRTGAVHQLVQAGSNGSLEDFESVVTVPAGAPDGSHVMRSWATHCDTGSPITGIRSHAYRIDSTDPAIDGIRLEARDGMRWVVVDTRDVGPAGFGVGAVNLTIEDLETGEVVESSTRYNGYDEETTSNDPFTVPPGHAFRITAVATDRAGNSATSTFEGVA